MSARCRSLAMDKGLQKNCIRTAKPPEFRDSAGSGETEDAGQNPADDGSLIAALREFAGEKIKSWTRQGRVPFIYRAMTQVPARWAIYRNPDGGVRPSSDVDFF